MAFNHCDKETTDLSHSLSGTANFPELSITMGCLYCRPINFQLTTVRQ